jgi:hypothetical protein
VDQMRRAPPRHRRWTEALSLTLTAAVGARADAVAAIHHSLARNHVDVARQGSHVAAAVREMKSQVICSDADVICCSSHLLEKIAHCMYTDYKREKIHIMSCKSRVQRLEAYFYEVNVWSPKTAKRDDWSPKYAIFSKCTDGSAGLSARMDQQTLTYASKHDTVCIYLI